VGVGGHHCAGIGGKGDGSDAVIFTFTGSLELMEAEQITDITGQQARAATARRAEPVVIGVPAVSQDLVIQNPPYSRARGDQ
jgi:hypothetical protein